MKPKIYLKSRTSSTQTLYIYSITVTDTLTKQEKKGLGLDFYPTFEKVQSLKFDSYIDLEEVPKVVTALKSFPAIVNDEGTAIYQTKDGLVFRQGKDSLKANYFLINPTGKLYNFLVDDKGVLFLISRLEGYAKMQAIK